MEHQLIFYPHDTLITEAHHIDRIDRDIDVLLARMQAIMMEKQGVGIASPQVNVPLQCFLVSYDDTIHTFINPSITWRSQETGIHEEGCLSIPKVYADVVRPVTIRVQAQNQDGDPFTLEAGGFFARIIQHECDHLQGTLFIDHLPKGMQRRILTRYEKLRSV